LLPVISGKPLWSRRLVDYSFWGVSIGVSAFYVLLIIFGIVEGNLLLTDPKAVPEVHRYYAPIISIAATVMGIGFWMFFANVFLTAKAIYKRQ
jgi:cbb3-type cytochrome oxidase subunit 1